MPLLNDIGDLLELGVLTVDSEMTIRSWNHWLEIASGHPAANVVGRTLYELFPEFAGSASEAAVRRALAGGTVILAHRFHRYLLRFPPPAGEGAFDVMQQSARIVPLVDPDEGVRGAIILIQDVTERVAREAELSETMVRAQSANQAKSNFLAAMSHELRTPIGAISGYTDLIVEGILGDVTPAQLEHLQRIKAVSRHLLHIVDEILTFARAQAGREELHLADVDGVRLALDAAAVVEPLVTKKGLRLDLDLPAEPVPMYSDEVKIRQILINLLGNAAKFVARGRVSLSLWVDSTHVRLSVADTGPGIAPEWLETIFEPFTQLDSSLTRTTQGTGLGLAVSRQLARLLGGDLTVESRLGVGSTFTATLPVRTAISPPQSDGDC